MSNVASVGATRYRHAKKLHVQETFPSSMTVIDLIFLGCCKILVMQGYRHAFSKFDAKNFPLSSNNRKVTAAAIQRNSSHIPILSLPAVCCLSNLGVIPAAPCTTNFNPRFTTGTNLCV